MAEGKMIKLAGLWKNTSKSGEVFYGGNLTPSSRLLVFKNKQKRGETDAAPDLLLYVVPRDPTTGRHERETEGEDVPDF